MRKIDIERDAADAAAGDTGDISGGDGSGVVALRRAALRALAYDVRRLVAALVALYVVTALLVYPTILPCGAVHADGTVEEIPFWVRSVNASLDVYVV
jgi:hypothetical protein